MDVGMAVRISRALLAQILARAADSPDAEICGLLLGAKDRVTEARPSANVADHPARRFEIDPATLIAAHRDARGNGPSVLGHYHSHPGGDVRPSPRDAEMALADGALWLICAPSGKYTLWRTDQNGLHGRFVMIELLLDDLLDQEP
jgi:desampylase